MPKSPTLLKMLRNFSKDLKKFAAAGAPHVDKQQYEDRVKTCLGCEHLLRSKRCGLCGCVIELKAAWATAECPDGRWDKKPYHGRKSNTNNASD
jgi:hypothetical protein